MQTAALRTLVEVARLGSISAAADTLGYTQSAISRQIQALESETGARLLERLPRGVRLTTAGEVVERHARVILREVTRLAEAVAEPGSATATLSIGAVPSAAAALVPAVAHRLRAHHPEVRLRFVEGFTPDLFGRVARGELDLAVVTDYPPGLPATPGVVLHHLADDEVLVAMPADHRLAGPTRRVRLDRFADDDWVEDYRGSARTLVEACARSGFSPRIEHECGGWTGKLGLIAAGAGVGIVPGLMAGSVRPDIVCRLLVDPPVRGVYAAVHDPSAGLPVVTAMLAELADELAAGLGR
jgi:DNA-binding transcriptional LysR family regulator